MNIKPHLYDNRAARLLGSASSAALLLLVCAAAQAQPKSGEALNVRALAATCANCHGTDGKAVQGTPLIRLAGLPKAYIVQQMQDYKSGKRSATIMHQLSKGYTDAQIDAIATYFAAQK